MGHAHQSPPCRTARRPGRLGPGGPGAALLVLLTLVAGAMGGGGCKRCSPEPPATDGAAPPGDAAGPGAPTAAADGPVFPGFVDQELALQHLTALDMLPQDAVAVLAVDTPWDLVLRLGRPQTQVAHRKEYAALSELLTRTFGRDILDFESLKEAGIDGSKRAGLAVYEPLQPVVVFFVAADPARAADLVPGLLGTTPDALERTTEGEATLLCAREPAATCVVLRGGHAYVLASLAGADVRPRAKAVATTPIGDALGARMTLRGPVARLAFGGDIGLWVDVAGVARALSGPTPARPAADGPADDRPADDRPADDGPADDRPADDGPLAGVGTFVAGISLDETTLRARAWLEASPESLPRRLLRALPPEAAPAVAAGRTVLQTRLAVDPAVLWGLPAPGAPDGTVATLLASLLGVGAVGELRTALSGVLEVDLTVAPDGTTATLAETVAVGLKDPAAGAALLKRLGAAPALAGAVTTDAATGHLQVTPAGARAHRVAATDAYLIATSDPAVLDPAALDPAAAQPTAAAPAAPAPDPLQALRETPGAALRAEVRPALAAPLFTPPASGAGAEPKGLPDAAPEVPFSAEYERLTARITAAEAELEAIDARAANERKVAARRLAERLGAAVLRVDGAKDGLLLHAAWAIRADEWPAFLVDTVTDVKVLSGAEGPTDTARQDIVGRLETLRAERDRVRQATIEAWRRERGEALPGDGAAPSPPAE